MSRSGYSDDYDNWALIKWRGMVASAIRGKRGQKLLRDLAEAMDAMPEKVLIADRLVEDGDYCALGVVGVKRGINIAELDPDESDRVAQAFDIAECLAREVVYINDEYGDYDETPEQRWVRVRKWVDKNLKAEGSND